MTHDTKNKKYKTRLWDKIETGIVIVLSICMVLFVIASVLSDNNL